MTIRIAGFDPRWRDDFARLNLEWLRRWFVVEAFDEEVLGDPERHILADGGRILFALHDDGDGDGATRAVGTVALRSAGDGVYELTKMAVEPELRGAGIGRALLDAAIGTYRELGGRELYLESSSVLAPALRMYESAGFVHHPAPRAGSHYARADVHMIWEGG
jgi:GNAT superfamily N-acetyltransferase